MTALSFTGALLAACILTCGCAQKPIVPAATERASLAAQRGAQAFARGNLDAAQREYETELRIHESLGDTPARAATLLSLARIA